MLNATRSEIVRTRRKGAVAAWFGLTALFAVMMFFAFFTFVDSAEGAPERGPGVTFPSVETLTSPEGIVAPLASASSMFGIIALAFWALFTASDYSTGMIRLLAAAQPTRWKLVVGKVLALLMWTAVAATVALLATFIVAPAASASTSLDISAWQDVTVAIVAQAWVNVCVSMTIWGAIGMVLATITRSAAVAISIGAGWVLIVEGVLAVIVPDIADWLPGSTIAAIASGGTDALSYGAALSLGAVYLALCLGGTLAVYQKRDITD